MFVMAKIDVSSPRESMYLYKPVDCPDFLYGSAEESCTASLGIS